MAENETTEPEVFKTYTGARRFRKYIGRFLTGEKIWGGPYPLAVFVSGAIALGLVVSTYEIWRSEFILSDGIKGLVVVGGVMAIVWKLPATNRPIWAMALSLSHATFGPAEGKYGGESLRALKKPHPRYRQRRHPQSVVVKVTRAPAAPAEAPTLRPSTPHGMPDTTPTTPRRPVSALEVLLDQANAR